MFLWGFADISRMLGYIHWMSKETLKLSVTSSIFPFRTDPIWMPFHTRVLIFTFSIFAEHFAHTFVVEKVTTISSVTG